MARKVPLPTLPTLSGRKLHRFAFYLTVGYLLVCALYITISGAIVLQVAQSPLELARLELWKGLAFVGFTSVLFYFIARTLVNRILRQENELTEQRHALLEMETRAAAGIMAASVAHDIKNVLTLFNYQLYRLDHVHVKPIDQTKVVREMGEAVDRLNGLAVRLLALSRTGVSEAPANEDLGQILRDNVDFMGLHELVRTCELKLDVRAPVLMQVRRGLIDQMLLNLILNAAEAINGHGAIHVMLDRQHSDAVIEVHDSGTGISHAEQNTLFEVFYTTKPSGHGLGLFTVKACAELHHGQVTVVASPLGGACFRIRLPLDGHVASAKSAETVSADIDAKNAEQAHTVGIATRESR
ncbi:MAG: HAMP domain-containing sensor histidine kinase [Litorilinea sp.]